MSHTIKHAVQSRSVRAGATPVHVVRRSISEAANVYNELVLVPQSAVTAHDIAVSSRRFDSRRWSVAEMSVPKAAQLYLHVDGSSMQAAPRMASQLQALNKITLRLNPTDLSSGNMRYQPYSLHDMTSVVRIVETAMRNRVVALTVDLTQIDSESAEKTPYFYQILISKLIQLVAADSAMVLQIVFPAWMSEKWLLSQHATNESSSGVEFVRMSDLECILYDIKRTESDNTTRISDLVFACHARGRMGASTGAVGGEENKSSSEASSSSSTKMQKLQMARDKAHQAVKALGKVASKLHELSKSEQAKLLHDAFGKLADKVPALKRLEEIAIQAIKLADGLPLDDFPERAIIEKAFTAIAPEILGAGELIAPEAIPVILILKTFFTSDAGKAIVHKIITQKSITPDTINDMVIAVAHQFVQWKTGIHPKNKAALDKHLKGYDADGKKKTEAADSK